MLTKRLIMRCNKSWMVLSQLLIAVLAVTSMANDPTEQPLTISADSAVVDQTNNTTVYSGNVVLTQGNLELNASTLAISVADKDVDSITAQGNPVRIIRTDEQQCNVEGSGQHLEYNPSKKTIVLMGDAQLRQQQTQLEGERIVYNLDSAILKSEGRTRTTFPLSDSGKPAVCKPSR